MIVLRGAAKCWFFVFWRHYPRSEIYSLLCIMLHSCICLHLSIRQRRSIRVAIILYPDIFQALLHIVDIKFETCKLRRCKGYKCTCTSELSIHRRPTVESCMRLSHFSIAHRSRPYCCLLATPHLDWQVTPLMHLVFGSRSALQDDSCTSQNAQASKGCHGSSVCNTTACQRIGIMCQ